MSEAFTKRDIPAESRDDRPGRVKRRRRADRRRSGRPTLPHRPALRALYFGLASIWGFVVGFAGIALGLGLNAEPARTGSGLLLPTLVAALLALAGGIVISMAYRKASESR